MSEASSNENDIPLASLQEDTLRQLRAYLEELLAANEKFNLTAVRDEAEAWERHVVECVRLVPFVTPAAALLDVGSGGGLPGLVLAICCPTTRVTLLEATEKKARFLEMTSKKLGLSNVRVVAERAEDAGRPGSPYREAFDVVTARAVAPLPTLLELTVPFLRVGGTLLAIKGQRADQELEAAQGAFRTLSATLAGRVAGAFGTALLIRKEAGTAARYPRRAGEPKRRPLR